MYSFRLTVVTDAEGAVLHGDVRMRGQLYPLDLAGGIRLWDSELWAKSPTTTKAVRGLLEAAMADGWAIEDTDCVLNGQSIRIRLEANRQDTPIDAIVTVTGYVFRSAKKKRLISATPLYALGHDLREPARLILSYAQLLDRRYAKALGEDGKRMVMTIIDSSRRMREAVDEMMSSVRLELDGEAEQRKLVEVDMDEVYRAAVQNLALVIEEQSAKVICESALPKVRGRASELVRVLQNLIHNALNAAMPGRDCVVRVGAVEQGDGWKIWVSDNGRGIAPEHFKGIFRMFVRIGNSDGAGLGLPTSRRLVQRMGGKLWVESKLGEGATFFLLLSRPHPSVATEKV